jgi:antitoxin component YwqK of YwqJK toxin-antitoxin module
MIRYLLPVILLLMFATGFAQKDSIRKYLDEDLHLTIKRNGVYAAMAIKTGDHWQLVGVYPDTTMLLKIYFKDKALTIKDGPFTLYYPKNIVWQNGYFTNNMATGLWQTWYMNKQLKNAGTIINNHLSGAWKSWYDNGKPASEYSYAAFDSLTGKSVIESPYYNMKLGILGDFNPVGVLHGSGTTWYPNGNKESVVNYSNDSLSGNCIWFRENGNLSSKETYTNGKVTELECYDGEGKYTGATCSILKLPLFIHPFFSALDYIEYELHKEKNRDIKSEGNADVRFTVTKKGTIENLVIESSPDSALSKRIVKIFASMPAWSPAVIHNRGVDYPVQLEIPYYRD